MLTKMQFAHKGIWPWQVSAQDDFQSCRENKDMVCFRKASRVHFQRRAQPLQKSTAQVQDQRGREWLLQVSAQGKRLEGEAQTTPSTFEPLKKKFVCVCVCVLFYQETSSSGTKERQQQRSPQEEGQHQVLLNPLKKSSCVCVCVCFVLL